MATPFASELSTNFKDTTLKFKDVAGNSLDNVTKYESFDELNDGGSGDNAGGATEGGGGMESGGNPGDESELNVEYGKRYSAVVDDMTMSYVLYENGFIINEMVVESDGELFREVYAQAYEINGNRIHLEWETLYIVPSDDGETLNVYDNDEVMLVLTKGSVYEHADARVQTEVRYRYSFENGTHALEQDLEFYSNNTYVIEMREYENDMLISERSDNFQYEECSNNILLISLGNDYGYGIVEGNGNTVYFDGLVFTIMK